ncbi:MAG: NYN domain-containing protein [Thermoleophilia bacterium]
MIYIIDGYNVLHAREAGEINTDELEDKRRILVEDVISFMASEGASAVVVFDSHQAESAESHGIPNTPVTVSFASAAESADIIIGKLVQQKLAGTSEDIRVVSGDWEVQKGALMKRVERIPPRDFLSGMKNFAKKVAFSPEMDKMRWKLEHKVDVETLRRLEDMRRGRG